MHDKEVTTVAKVSMHITVAAEPRKDHWACFVPEFGFTVYGETRESARQEVDVALQVLLDSFRNDMDAIRRFLDSREVRYSIEGEGARETATQSVVVEMSHAEVFIAA